ncbi:hypothetical protein EXU57_12650 [Segetibacter sp. 3557_3]|uniref:hypothetical protein n=1 Tax=Segetibacter sp. 3557_3 TaxID=2547429 RepID=UPI00105851F4|nr:hypothetical protein [Segetibacter sp. 3557_3]TDH25550.1 hypothetical protein EXU57_12650 [Segetibacter sp. 3557_3]
MKRFTLLTLSLVLTVAVSAQTADEVVNKFIEASGGKEKLNAIRTLHYNQLIKFKSPMGDLDFPLQFFKEKHKLYRMQASLQLGPQSINMFVLLKDTAGYVMLPANPMTGSEGGIQKLEQKDLQDQAFQSDPSGMFASLVDYAAKGHKVELLESEKVDDQDSYKLKHTLGSGQSLTYFISKANNLVNRVDAKGSIAANMSGFGSMMGGMAGGNSVEKMEITTLYGDYKSVDGIKFPTRVVYKTHMGDSESEVTNIEINKAIDPKWYLPN